MKYIAIFLVALSLLSCSNKKNKTDWEKHNLKGKVLSYSQFGYSAKERIGNIEKGKRYGLAISKKYDEKGNVIEGCMYHSDGSLKIKDIYKYDEKGNMIERYRYNSDGNLNHKSIYKYDEKGNEVEWCLYNSDGSLEVKYTHKYNEKGNKIEDCEYNSDSSLKVKYTYKYEFDKQGNWIKKISFKNNIPSSIWERRYEYYK